MENILETTRRQNAASSLIPKSKLAGLDRHAVGRGVESDLPEIIIVSVPDLGHSEIAAPHAAALVSHGANQASNQAASSATTGRERISTPIPSTHETQGHPPLAGPHSPVSRRSHDERMHEERMHEERAYDSPSADHSFDSAYSDSKSEAHSQNDLRDTSEIESHADRLFAEIGNIAAEPDQEILNDLQVSSPFKATSKDSSIQDEDRSSDDSTATVALRDDAAAQTLLYANPSAPFGTLAPRRILPQYHAEQDAAANEAAAAGTTIPTNDSTDETLVTKTNELETKELETKELNSRLIELRERHGRTIARSLYDLPAIADATTLLMVATGGVRRALDAVECLGRGLAWHLDRDVRLVSLEAHTAEIWSDLPEAVNETEIASELTNRSRLLRSSEDRRLQTLELAIEADESRRLTPNDLRSAVKRDRRDGVFSVWLIDGAETEMSEALAAACDATLMLVDLHSSRVASSRWVVTHLREHGARIVGSIVVNAFEEEA